MNLKSNVHTCVECDQEFAGRKKKYCSKGCSDEARRKRIRKTSSPKPDVMIKCEWCGMSHSVPSRTAHQARFCSDDCRYTFHSRNTAGHRPENEWLEIRAEQKRKRISIKLKEKEQRVILLTKGCVECGELFYNPYPLAVTCSKKCNRRRSNRLSEAHKNKRINEFNLIDKDITLEKLFKRDKGTCHLCNSGCNFNDIMITTESYYIVGRSYPSIDHVKPLSKGGKHSWDNIKLAHHYCNTIKSNNENKEEVINKLNEIQLKITSK